MLRRSFLGAVALLALTAGMASAEGKTPAADTLHSWSRELAQAVERNDAIEELNRSKQLSYPVPRFVLLSREFSMEKGELTATHKLNRKQINHNFKHFIDLYYS